MNTKLYYPIGIQDFEKIRDQHAVYVDKTALIYELTHTSNSAFLSRPRRFGKSLLSSTLQYYFEGRRELFTGLAIEKLETEWTKHPVLHFDFSTPKDITAETLPAAISSELKEYESLYGRDEDEIHLSDRLRGLIKRAYQKTGKKVVLIVDEYDGYMLEVLHKESEVEGVRAVMRDFFSPIKRCDSYLRFVFLTGISTFSQLGMFSELNNLNIITNDADYASICGITIPELTENFKEGIQQLAEKQRCTADEAVDMLREQYDGYHFTKDMVDVFNPYSLLYAFQKLELTDYWFRTGTPAFVIEMLKKHRGNWKFDVEEIDGTRPMSINRFSTPLEQANGPIPFLYQAGYLTIKRYLEEESLYILGVPNTEVRVGLLMNLIPLYSAMDAEDAFSTANMVSTSLCKGDYDTAMKFVQSFMASIPFMSGDKEILNDIEKCEAYYHRIFFTIFYMLHNGVKAQVLNAIGIADVIIHTSRYIYVIEIKIDSSADIALQQIEEKGYARQYLTDDREIIKLGVNFSSKTRTIEEWKRG